MPATGRPRDASVDQRVLTAVRELLAEHGYARLRIDAVAQRSGVAKTTIYRRWPGLVHLVVAAMTDLVGDRRVAATDDPERDLHEVCRVGLRSLRQAGPSLAALALEVHQQDDDELRRAYRRALVDPLRDALIDAMERGQAAGVFRSGIDARVTADALIGAALYRLVILREPAGEEDLDALLDVVLEGLRVG